MEDLQEFLWSWGVFFDLFCNDNGVGIVRWHIVSLGSLALLDKDNFRG